MGINEKNNSREIVTKNNRLVELKLFGLIMANVHSQQEQTLERYEIDVSLLKDQTNDKNFYA